MASRMHSRRSSRCAFRPSVELLEDRRLLSTITWSGAADGSWNNAANWDLARAPANGDDLVFPATASGNFSNTNDVPGLTNVHSIVFTGTFSGPTNHYTIGGAALTVNDPYRGMVFDRGRLRLPEGPGLGVSRTRLT